MSESEYSIVLDSAPDRRTTIAMRIAGESGPRLGLIVRIQRCDFYVPHDPDVEIVLLKIRGAKDTTEDGTGGERITWVPRDLYEEIIDYCQRENINDEEELFDVGAERMRQLIKEAGENAVVATGEWDYQYLTPHDLRAYFATSMIRRNRVDKEVVKSMGGWNSDKALKPYLDVALPRDIQDELARQGLVEVEVPNPPRRDELAALYEEVREIRELLKISEVMEEHEISIEQLKAIEDEIDALDEGNPEPSSTNLNRFHTSTGLVSAGTLAATDLAGDLAAPVKNHVDELKAKMEDDPSLVDPGQVDTAKVTVMALLSVCMVAYGISASTLPTTTAAALYAAAIPVATGKAYWDIFYGDE